MAVRQLGQSNEVEIESKSIGKNKVVALARGAESTSDRIRRLQWEASMLASEQAEAFANELMALAARAVEIAEGGEAYPAGVRELSARIAADLPQKANSLLTILHRSGSGS